LFIACPGNIIAALAGSVFMRNPLLTALVFILLSVGLSGCGNKGPLYLPDEDEKKEKVE
jgi:hypothetical protein